MLSILNAYLTPRANLVIQGSRLTLESHARAWSSSPALPCRARGLSPILHQGQVLPIWCGYIPSVIALTAITTINAYLVKMEVVLRAARATAAGILCKADIASSIVKGGLSFVLDSSPNYLTNGQTLVAVAPSITIGGTPVSLDTAGDHIVGRTHTEDLQTSTMNGAQM